MSYLIENTVVKKIQCNNSVTLSYFWNQYRNLNGVYNKDFNTHFHTEIKTFMIINKNRLSKELPLVNSKPGQNCHEKNNSI